MLWEPCGMVCVFAATYIFGTGVFLAAFIGSVVGAGEIVYRRFINRGYRYRIVTSIAQYLVVVAASVLLGILLFV